MRFLIEEIRRALSSFIAGSHHVLMLLTCEPEHSSLVLKTIDSLEDDPNVADIFLTFGHTFENVFSYVDKVVESLREQSEQLNTEFAKRGDPAIPFPADLQDSLTSPMDRMLRAMEYVRSIIPRGRRVVWIFHPLQILQPDSYLHLMGFIRHNLDIATLRGTRVIARDSVTSPVLAGLAKDDRKIRIYKPDLDPQALEKKLNTQAGNAGLPLEEQAQIHMMLAGMEIANKQFDQALVRNQELLGYFFHSGQKHNQSIVLNNIGDLNYIQGRFAEAQGWYEKAIGIAVELQSQPLVMYQSLNLGHALLMQRKFDEASVYYDAAGKLAHASNVPVYEIQSLEHIGRLKQESGQMNEAAQAWEKAAELSKTLQYEAGRQAMLERLRDLYKEMGRDDKLSECEKALSELASSLTRGSHV
jgi:tetratricopeptide (TPR) repeat protein